MLSFPPAGHLSAVTCGLSPGQAYVSCGIGVHMVGYVMICYGVCDALCSVSFSTLVKLVGRVPVFTMGAVINFGVIIALIHWRPHPDDTPIFFVLAGLWGVSDAVWQTQINGEHFTSTLKVGKMRCDGK